MEDFDNVIVESDEVENEELDTSMLSDEELEAALNGEGIGDTVEATEDEDSEAPDESEPDEADQESDKEEESKDEPDDVVKLKKMVEDSQKMIGKQGNELGTIRKRNAELEEIILKYLTKKDEPEGDEPDPEAWENPRKVARDEFKRMQAEEALTKNQIVAQRERIREDIQALHPDFDESLIIEVAKSDGVPEEDIPQVIEGIWNIDTTPDALELRQRLLIHSQVQRAKLIRENKQLKEELERSKSESKGVKKNILTNLKKAAKKSAPSTVGTGTSGVTEVTALTPEQISRLSSQQLAELLERINR